MFELVFLFTGLCGFAMDGQAGDRYADGLDVILVQTDEHVVEHVAELVVEKSAIDEKKSELKCSEPPQYGEYCAFDLSGKEVSVLNSDPRSEMIKWTPLQGRPKCPTERNKSSYGWVAPMSWVTPGEGRVRDDLRRLSRSRPPQVRAAVKLERGELSNRGFAVDSDDGIILWKFGRGFFGSKIETALGDLVEVRQKYWEGPVTLAFLDIENGDTKTLTLKPAPAGTDRLVEVFNTPVRDVCTPRLAWAKASDGEVPQNDHFEYLYDLLPNPVRSKPEFVGPCPEVLGFNPHPDRCSVKTAASNPQCPGADVTNP